METIPQETEHMQHSASAQEAPEVLEGTTPVSPVAERTEIAEAKIQRQTQMLAQWTEFGFWLADAGLIVYRNSIERERDWRWAWGDNAGNGYANITAAVIAALQHHVLSRQSPEIPEAEDGIPLDLSMLADPPEPIVSLWNQLLTPTKQKPSIAWWKRLFPNKQRTQQEERVGIHEQA
jgi:hypothetical protein